jgi:hypothetical protein
MSTTPAPGRYQLMILTALQDKPMYMGTVSYAEKLKRRARGKRAKLTRKRQRGK